VTLARAWIPSPNYSSRAGTAVRLIVLHTAEGALSYQSLGNYFGSAAAQVSSHVGIDDTPGVVGEYVARGDKAWTQANANPYSVAAELCAFAAWGPTDWAAHPVMLQNAAEWVAEEAAAFGIPVVALTAEQAQDGRSKGVCQHADLGAAGGGHWDCGSSFPMAQVLDMATGQEEQDLTDDQDQILREVWNMLTGGFSATDAPPSVLYDRLVNGTADANPTGFGALQTLDSLIRSTYNKVCELSDRLDALG
jgi:N-acetylmuramoyl-L-alanine amidase